MDFLDDSLARYGKDSAAYIRSASMHHVCPLRLTDTLTLSFGTNFWPVLRPELVTAIIESLLELSSPIPFVFATAMPNGKIEPELKKRVESSGRGLVVDWAPQVRVLRHEAVGMFLVECSLLADVSLINILDALRIWQSD